MNRNVESNFKQLKNNYFSSYSQVSRILGEFDESYMSSHSGAQISYDVLEKLQEIISNLRCAFRDQKDTSGQAYNYNLWACQTDEFLSEIKELPESEQKDLKEKYDRIWQYFDINSIIKAGELESQMAKAGFNPNTESIEDIASELLKLNNIYSETLERLILDSLIHCETMAFARYAVSKESFLGSKVSSIIQGQKSSGFWETIGQWFRHLAIDVVKITLTYGIASLLTGENTTAAWIITCSYTGYRWYSMSKVENSTFKELSLLNKMVQVHAVFSKPVINYRLLRDQLYRIEAEGARFSQMVYEVLDRLIMRRGC